MTLFKQVKFGVLDDSPDHIQGEMKELYGTWEFTVLHGDEPERGKGPELVPTETSCSKPVGKQRFPNADSSVSLPENLDPVDGILAPE